MEIKMRIFLLAFIFYYVKASAQFNQIELFSGSKKTNFTNISIIPLNSSNHIEFFNLLLVNKYHNTSNHIFDEFGIQPILFFNLNDKFSIGPSFYYNTVAGFSERISMRYKVRLGKFFFTIIPTVAHSEKSKTIDGSSFIQLQFNKPINEKWKFWFNSQLLYSWRSFEIHARSFQQIRIGFSHTNNQFGLGLDLDQYGPAKVDRISFGLYYRKRIN